jgi:hypothetical protein
MRIDILTTKRRDTTVVDQFWRSHGWSPVYWDNTDALPGLGRNRILTDFYASDRPWLAMADDDMVIDVKRGAGAEFLSDPYRVLNKIAGEITSFGLMNNIHHRVDITLTNPALQDHWVFYRASWIGCLVFHHRTGQQFYNNETDILEDMDWCLDQIQAGHHVAHCMNIVQRCVSGSSTIFQDQAQRRQRYLAAKRRILKQYPGITLSAQNRLVKTRFLNQYWPVQTPWKTVKDIGPCWRLPK